MILTKEKLEILKESLGKPKILYGLAVSPILERELRNSFKTQKGFCDSELSRFCGTPIIVDGRLANSAEAYYDRKVWVERVKNQNKWDELQNNSSHSKEGV